MQVLEELWVDYMMNGKVNPTSGIFIGSNHFGYRDVRDVNITPNAPAPLGPEPDPEEIAERWQALPSE